MGRYPFITGVTEFLKKDGDYYEDITRKSYDRKLRFFGRIFEDLKKEGKVSSTNPRKITEDDIYAFVGTRVKDNIKPDTILHDLSTLRLFLMNFGNNAVEKYKIKYRTRVPRAHHERREALSEDVAIKIFKRAKTIDEDSWRLMEAYSLVSVAISTGLRPGELRKLYRNNVRKDEDGYIIHAVHVKGEKTYGKPRDVPVLWDGGEILERYLVAREKKLKAWGKISDALFPPLRCNTPFLSSNAIIVLKKLVEDDLGIKFPLYICRHTFGQIGFDEGHQIHNISRTMGHKTVKTTQEYYADKRQSAAVDEMRRLSRKTLAEGNE